ncbi:pentatricopeptide repeat-containing protein At1g08070, chloroplastic-like [Typha latifolia]|uniref:pentatricopeptide repeat-containing protein At1g08070, chloroplastic-like n=1 Tax=Typha latifolia TaxID=4733 RepID=UPI003C2D5478
MKELKQFQAIVLKSKSLQTHLIISKILTFCALSPCGDISHARSLLARIENPTVSVYNSILRGIAGREEDPVANSLSLLEEMLQRGIFPDNYTFPLLIKVLADSRALAEGEAVHAHVVKMGFQFDVYVRNNFMRLYAVCGEVGSAQNLFDCFPDRDLVSWTTLISGYSKMGLLKEAVSVFLRMMDENLDVDKVTVVAVLSACAKIGDLELGKKLHGYINAKKVDLDVFAWNALVDMYAKCGDVISAYKYFKRMPERNVVSWNSMISGFVHVGEFGKALSLFRKMQNTGIKPDIATLIGVLNSCANLGALDAGRWIHVYTIRSGLKADGSLGNALIDMYAKCGIIDQAMEVFGMMRCRDVYTYTSLIVGSAMHGQGDKALDIFSEMLRVGIKPNEVTFTGVLSACSHAGLVDIGLRHFGEMSTLYGIKPAIEHYGCVVDMFGRAGLLEKAQEFIRAMPIEPDAFIWGSLLGACKIHGKVPLGEKAMEHLLDFGPEEDGSYVLMSNIYTSADRRNDSTRVRKAMRKNRVRKTPGCSLIEIDGIVHEFRVRK